MGCKSLKTYDAVGNLVNDGNEGVTISWTPYGKVRTVHKGDSVTVSYRYDAAGNRVEKKMVKDSLATITQYLRDASGNVMAIYKDTASTEVPIYGSARLGEYKGGVFEGARILGKRNFELSNHLGNVLAVITDNAGMKADSVWAKVVSASDYYPFGLEMKGRTWSDTTSNYRYGFNGKEKDSAFASTTDYDYGFRVYSPEIAKFLSVDPLAREFPSESNYVYAGNSPVQLVDDEGKKKIYYVTKIAADGKTRTTVVVVNKYEVREITTRTPNAIKVAGQTLYTGTDVKTRTYDLKQEIVIDAKGNVTAGQTELAGERSNNVITRYVQDNLEEINNKLGVLDKSVNGGGGISFTSGIGQGQETRSGKNRDAKAENIDLLLSVLNSAKTASEESGGTIVKDIKAAMDMLSEGKDVVENGEEQIKSAAKPKKAEDSLWCTTCKIYVPDSEKKGHDVKTTPIKNEDNQKR